MATIPLDDPQQRASVREAVLQFRGFLDQVPEPGPAELRDLIERLVERTADAT